MTGHLTLGAIFGESTTFRVWAPGRGSVELVIESGDERVQPPMDRDGDYFTASRKVSDGARYGFIVDGNGPFPDPCSRSQPEGVHALSAVVDPGAFEWTDVGFSPPEREDLVIYEAHIGTLTPAGTFDAAIERLSYLSDLGVTAIEILPVASFPGERGWGYDGVALFAPFAPYGGPEGMRRFVDAAHGKGIAVILDVVYNHFGPDGNYTGVYSDYYFTDRHSTPWGNAINYDGEHASEVRRFVVENLIHWIQEYHIDGFRFDATHAIVDTSAEHILAEASRSLREHYNRGRHVFLFAETMENDVTYLRSDTPGGQAFDGIWTDDFHHILRNNLRDENDGYLAHFGGTTRDLADVISRGWYFEGQTYAETGQPRGTLAREQPWSQFVYCMQNHDQVGNRAFGDRISSTVGRDNVLAATLLMLCLPQTPLLFQGQEYLATTPFQYFSDHNEELGRLVSEGRRREFASFRAFADERVRGLIPDPQAPDTFEASKLDLREASTGLGALALNLHRDLLALRASDRVLREMRRGRPPLVVAAGEGWLSLEMRSVSGWRVIALNLGRKAINIPLPGPGSTIIASNSSCYGGTGTEISFTGLVATVPPQSAALIGPQR